MRLPSFLAVAVALLLFPTAVLAQDRPSTEEMTRLSPEAADRLVRRDLLSILRPTGEVSSGMFIQLHGVGLTTRAYGTEFDGLCRHDAISLLYAPTGSNAPPRDQPLRPYGIETSIWFHVDRLPDRERERDQRRVDLGLCGRLDRDENANWFSAKNAREAAEAANLLTAAVGQVKTGTLKAKSCGNSKDRCEPLILQKGKVDQIDSVEACPAEHDAVCYVIDVAGSLELTIVGRLKPDSVVASQIASIEAREYIIVT